MNILITESQYNKLINNKETVEDFYNRFKEANPNPQFLINHFKNPNFQLRLTHDEGVRFINDFECEKNKCETNTFKVLKRLIGWGIHRYFPVSGWAFMKSTAYFEHFWIYDKVEDMFIDVSPMGEQKPYAYGGVVNYEINQDIVNADKFSDIEFLKGKHHTSLYHKFQDMGSNPKFDNGRKQMDMMDYIHSEPKYKQLSDFSNQMNIQDFNQLLNMKNKVEQALDNARSNREFNTLLAVLDQMDALKYTLK